MRGYVLLAATGAALSSASFGRGTMNVTAAGFTIPDNTAGGASSSVSVNSLDEITGLKVTLTNLAHTYVGDLTATLTFAPDAGSAVSFNLFSRVGRTGGTGTGDSSNFGGTYTFSDAPISGSPSSGNLWNEVTRGGSSYVVRNGQYRTTGAGSATFTSLTAAFGGLTAKGTWSLRIVDAEAVDLGTLGSWGITLELRAPVSPVPMPGPAAMASAGLLAVALRRPRR